MGKGRDDRMFVKPNPDRPGVIVKHPITNATVPPEGAWLPGGFARRALRRGDAVLGVAPSPKNKKSEPKEKKAPAAGSDGK